LNLLVFVPGVYCGSTEYATQPLIEIVSNAIDEFKAGNGNVIDVNIYKDKRCSVKDYAQGFLINSLREDGKTILQAAFDTLNTSGKFSEDGVYEGTALGLNGIGSKLTNFLSHWLIVKSCRGGKSECIKFKEGVFETRTLEDTKEQGTYVEWLPSEEFFTSNEVEISRIKNLFETLVCLCPGLTINLTIENEDKTYTYFSKNGLNDLVDKKVEDTELINNRMSMSFEEGKNKLDMVITYTSRYSLNMISYVNTGETDAGPHITQVKTILTREFNKFFKEKKWLKEKDSNFSGDDLQEGLFVAFNITAPNVSYDAQTKSRIVKIDMSPFTSSIVENLHYWFESDEKEIKVIFDKAASARKAREAAKKAREAVRDKNGTKGKKILNLPTKLVDAWSKNREECELLIAEGDSAGGGLIGARDGEKQAIFPIRGKIINLYKNSSDKVFTNQEVVNIIKALGLTLDPKTKKLVYDTNKLRYGKIIMCCDADPDGEAIKNLLLTYFWSLCPELIINGHLYAAIPPLFRITTKKNEYIYLRDSSALENYKKEHEGEKFSVNRNKGLGEQDAEELEECLLNPKTRNIVQITVSDVRKTEILFETLMGTAVPPRREYILKYSEEANE
jgi:DNA gyrase/topoisomerase IV subunit B